MNRLNVIGNLTADPIERTAGDHKVASFTVAENSGSGEKKTVQYFRVTAWNKLADVVLGYAKKGTKVYVSGPMKLTVTEKDGKTYYNNEIYRADDFLLLSSGDPSQKSAGGQTARQTNTSTNNNGATAEEEDDLPF